MQCCDKKLLVQILQSDPNVLNKSELEQFGVIRRLAVVPANRPWKGGELVQSPFARGGGKSTTCKAGAKWTEKRCREARKSGELANHTLENVETPRDVLDGSMLEENWPEDAAIFIEHKELARQTGASDAKFGELGHREQQSSSPAIKAKLRASSKCGGDLVRASQVREKSTAAIGTPEIRGAHPPQQALTAPNTSPKSSPTKIAKSKAEKEETAKSPRAVGEGPDAAPTAGSHRMVRVPEPNKIPWTTAQSGTGQSSTMQPVTGQSGTMQPGTGQPGTMQPGTGQSGTLQAGLRSLLT